MQAEPSMCVARAENLTIPARPERVWGSSPHRRHTSARVNRPRELSVELADFQPVRRRLEPEQGLPPAAFDNGVSDTLAMVSARGDVPEGSALQRFYQALDAVTLVFDPRSEVPPGVHQAMEKEYATCACALLERRERLYGDTPGGSAYRLDQQMSVEIKAGLLPMAFDGLRQFWIGAGRAPTRNAVVTRFAPGPNQSRHSEINNALDATLAGGAAAGCTAWLAEAWVSAIDRRAKLSNFPTLQPVDMKVLLPEPFPVQLQISTLDDGTKVKSYWRPCSDAYPNGLAIPDASSERTLAGLQCIRAGERAALVSRQNMLEGKSYSAFLDPTIVGAANVLRRVVSSPPILSSPFSVFLTTVVASGVGGAASRMMLAMGKSVPRVSQAEIDNLIGGKQRINLFKLARPDPTKAPVGWSDLRTLPRFVGEVWREFGDLLMHGRTAKQAAAQFWDAFGRTIGSSALISVACQGTGNVFGQVARKNSPGPTPDESVHSGGSLLDQFGLSGFNVLGYQAMRALMGPLQGDLGVTLDHRRAVERARHIEISERTRVKVLHSISLLRQHMGAVPAHAGRWRNAGPTLANQPGAASALLELNDMLQSEALVLAPTERHLHVLYRHLEVLTRMRVPIFLNALHEELLLNLDHFLQSLDTFFSIRCRQAGPPSRVPNDRSLV